MIKVIVDNNLWISFLIGKRLSQLDELICSDKIVLFACDELIEEFIAVVSRPKIRKYCTEEDIENTLQLIRECCSFINLTKSSVSPVRDVKDLYLLSLSEAVDADYILTGDKDLLVLGHHLRTSIRTFHDFIHREHS